MTTFWVLMAFIAVPINNGQPIQVDEFHFSTQTGCELARMRMTTAVTSLDIRCVQGKQEKPSE